MIDFLDKMFEKILDDKNGEKKSPAQEYLFKVNEEDVIKLEETKKSYCTSQYS